MSMKILAIEPYYGGSHRHWLDGLQRNSLYEIDIWSLEPRHWKWRMQGAALSMASRWDASSADYDLIIASDMLDISSFKGLVRSTHTLPKVVLYMHENQLVYQYDDDPERSARDLHYAFINYKSCLAADRVFFNSAWHQLSFTEALTKYLMRLPDHIDLSSIDVISQKSRVLPVGISYPNTITQVPTTKPEKPIILWNHRWEDDKGPNEFFEILHQAKANGAIFGLIVCGEQYRERPIIFDRARQEFAEEIIHWGYCDSRTEYANLLHLADIVLMTSKTENFGISLMEALYHGCIPLVPDRLVYPDYITDQRHRYRSMQAAVKKLIDILDHYQTIDCSLWIALAQSFAWPAVIGRYDAELGAIIHS